LLIAKCAASEAGGRTMVVTAESDLKLLREILERI
jgi:hypothetical protein